MKVVGQRSFVVVGSTVLVVNEKGQLLLQHKKEGKWCLPGSLMELGETLEDTARRAVYEEAGLVIGNLQMLGVYSGKNYIFRFDDENEGYAVTAVYVTRDILGEIKENAEINQARYFDFTKLPENIESEDQNYIEAYLKQTLPSVTH